MVQKPMDQLDTNTVSSAESLDPAIRTMSGGAVSMQNSQSFTKTNQRTAHYTKYML